MKIINYSMPDRKPMSRDEFVIREISRLWMEMGLTAEGRLPGIPLDFYSTETYLHYLERMVKVQASFNKEIEAEDAQTKPVNHSSFPIFTRLPIEIRLTIWGIAFADHCRPRVHCIDELTHRFQSNHAISPVLHVCRESRNHYLTTTKATFAFETYINLSTDTIYIPELGDPNKQFPQFLEAESTSQIQKLALEKDLYCDLPGEGHMSQVYMEVRKAMPALKEITVVFDDTRSMSEAWPDVDMAFKDLSAIQKRKRAERGYARQYAKSLERFLADEDLEPMRYRFAVVENSEEAIYNRA